VQLPECLLNQQLLFGFLVSPFKIRRQRQRLRFDICWPIL